MKNKIIVLILLLSGSAFAQEAVNAGPFILPPVPTNAPPSSPQNFLQTAMGYFTSFSDLKTFLTNDTIDIWTGAEYIQNTETAMCLGLSYNTAWKPFGGFIFGVESVTRNVPGLAGSAILSQNLGVNLQKVYKDVKVVAYVDPGIDFHEHQACVEVGLRFFKALTPNTAMGLGISERVGLGSGKISDTPTISLFALVKF